MQEGAASEIADLFSTDERHTHPEGHRPLPADRKAADLQASNDRRMILITAGRLPSIEIHWRPQTRQAKCMPI